MIPSEEHLIPLNAMENFKINQSENGKRLLFTIGEQRHAVCWQLNQCQMEYINRFKDGHPLFVEVTANGTQRIEPSSSQKLMGGWQTAENEELVTAANALKSEVQSAANMGTLTHYEVICGTKQVVGGMNYRISIHIAVHTVADIEVFRSLPPFVYELKTTLIRNDKKELIISCIAGVIRSDVDCNQICDNMMRSDHSRKVGIDTPIGQQSGCNGFSVEISFVMLVIICCVSN